MPIATFGSNFKRLVLVGDLFLWLIKLFQKYHKIVFYVSINQYSFKKSRRDFGFDHPKAKLVLWPQYLHKDEVSTLTPVDASKLGFTVQLPNVGTHKIDGSTLKNKDGWQECLDIPEKVYFLKSETKIAQMKDKFGKACVLLSKNSRIILCQQGFIDFNLTFHSRCN